jgi:DNA-3-methyladenine glycosylase II
MGSFTIAPRGPFDLGVAQDFAGGFAPGLGGHAPGSAGPVLLMAFPVEGWQSSAAVNLWQDADGLIHGDVAGSDEIEQVKVQAARSLSLDHDGTGWPDVGKRDPMIGRLQDEYRYLRPVCFYSAYEAATSLVIGQRIAMRQGARVKRWLADEHGDHLEIGGQTVSAFPRPGALLGVESVPGISAEKVRRLHALAQAALDGALDTAMLRSLPEEDALARLGDLPGIGPWTAQGVLMRGCGAADSIPTEDAISREAIRHFYDLADVPDDAAWTEISDRWRPYRMWATVLLHMAWRRQQASTPSYRQAGGSGKRRRRETAAS